ncbi:MAG TPA: 50S ribosomal protein L25 [bacterium]|jgi:large subunit ribosomal protein L25
MAIIKLKAESRENTGTRASTRLRGAGFIPANLYSHGNESKPLSLEDKSWSKAIEHEAKLVYVGLPEGKEQLAAVREIQRNPLDHKIIHIDLLGIREDEPIQFSVRVEFLGTPIGMKEGGVQQIGSDHVDITCLPNRLPDHIECDISHLTVGDSIFAKDLVMPEGSTLESDPDMVLLGVVMVRVVLEEPAEGAKGEEGEAGEGEGEEGAGKSERDEDSKSED